MSGSMFHYQIKSFSRQAITMNARICLRASTGVVAISLILASIQMNFGHLLIYYLLDAAANPGVSTGAQVTAQGVAAALRLEPAGIILAIQMTWGEIGLFVLESLIILLLTVPVTYGALEHFLSLLHRRVPTLKSLFRWYTDLGMTLRAMVLELILTVVHWGLRLLGMVPGLLLFVNGEGGTITSLSGPLMLLGALLAYGVSCQLDPARYFLANDPRLGVLGALRKGVGSLKGRHVDFFWFSFSFIGWELITTFTYGLGDIYLLPYRGLATILYVGIVDPDHVGEVPSHV